MPYSQARQDFDPTGFIISGHFFTQYPLTMEQDAARSAVLSQYTVLGRKNGTVPTTGTADGGNTGDGTVTAVAADAYSTPQIGAYNLECVTAVANGGVFKLEDPNGNIVTNTLTLTVGAGASTVFTSGGLTFTITDGAADFIVGDKFSITVTANGKYVPLDPVATDGSQAFAGIYKGADITAAALVAGDVTIDVITQGADALVVSDKLVFENGVTLNTVLPSGKTMREEMELKDISAGETLNIDRPENS